MVHNQAINKLSSSDYLVIEKEHELLKNFLKDLREACKCSALYKLPNFIACSHEQMTSCQGRLASFLFYAINLAGKHFDHEEAIMLSRPHVTDEYEYFKIHRQAHAEIMHKLNELVDECISLSHVHNPAEVYDQFINKLTHIFDEHDRTFDDPFILSTKS